MRDPDRPRDLSCVQRAGAAGGHQHEVARVETLAHRIGLDRVDHVVDGHRHDPERRLLGRQAQRLADGGRHRRPGQVRVEAHPPAQERLGTQPPQHHVGVGDGRIGAAAAVGGRSRIGAGALRADADHTTVLGGGDRAAAGPDRLDVEHRDHHRVAVDRGVQQVLHPRLPAGGHADVGGGASDVERDHALKAAAASGVDAPQLPGRRPGEHEVHRRLVAFLECGHPARALHQVRRPPHALPLERLLQPVQVAPDARVRCTR